MNTKIYHILLISILIFWTHRISFCMQNNLENQLQPQDENNYDTKATQKLLVYVNSGHDNLVKRFLEQKADPNGIGKWGISALAHAQEFEHSSHLCKNIIELLKQYDACIYPTIFIAIENNDIKEVEIHLKNGTNVNARNEKLSSPLDLAIKSHNKDITKLLLRYGANPKLGPIISNSSALTRAAQQYMTLKSQSENKELIKIILEYLSSFKNDPQKQLEILCQPDEAFKQCVLYFLMSLKALKIKIPKPLKYNFLLRTWALEHSNDYRCKIWFGDTQQVIKELITNSHLLTNIDYALELDDDFKKTFNLNANHTCAEEEACIEIGKLLESYF